MTLNSILSELECMDNSRAVPECQVSIVYTYFNVQTDFCQVVADELQELASLRFMVVLT